MQREWMHSVEDDQMMALQAFPRVFLFLWLIQIEICLHCCSTVTGCMAAAPTGESCVCFSHMFTTVCVCLCLTVYTAAQL